MPIDLAQVDWIYVGVLSVLVFFASLIGSLVTFQRRGTAATVTALGFAALFVAWTYYPHGLPLPTSLASKQPPAAAAPAPKAPTAPVKPANPVTDITPPRNPVIDVTPAR